VVNVKQFINEYCVERTATILHLVFGSVLWDLEHPEGDPEMEKFLKDAENDDWSSYDVDDDDQQED
jgi:hypothetical protein